MGSHLPTRPSPALAALTRVEIAAGQMCLQSTQHPCKPDPQSRNTPLTAAGNHAKDSPKSSSTPTNTALPRHLRKSGSGSPCCLPVDPERESGRGGANTASAVGFPDIECACEAAWGAPPGFWLCAAGLCREDSCRVTRRCAMVHLSECAGLWGACGKRGPWLGAAALPYSAVSPQSTLFLDCVALASLELTR